MNFVVAPKTKLNQELAANPMNSVFVSANAGAGKTYVLSRRVLRLMLSGVAPSKILCLTYTKAAAAEMQTRVFDQLRNWAALKDEELEVKLQELEGETSLAAPARILRRKQARRLFAQALETPGGLRIQTIHGFCQAILQQFPLEAGIAGKFEVLDDELRERLLTQAKLHVVGEARQNKQSDLGRALSELMQVTTEFGLQNGIDRLIAKRSTFRAWVPSKKHHKSAMAELFERLGIEQGQSPTQLLETELPHIMPARETWLSYIAEEATQGKTAITRSERATEMLAQLDRGDFQSAHESLSTLLLTGGEVRSEKSMASSHSRKTLAGLEENLKETAEKLVALNAKIGNLKAAIITGHLAVFGQHILEQFEKAKQFRGLLDYEDLVERTAHLLTRQSASSWVQYKLDQGIHHILVDEAQDTSPPQWRIIRALVDEYFSGEGAVGSPDYKLARTLFAVGDEKQSIYSFQGAAPQYFAQHRRQIERLADAAKMEFKSVQMLQSFRSTQDVLSAVDAVFADDARRFGLTFDGLAPEHWAARESALGEVEIWPLEKPIAVEEPDSWVDELPEDGLKSPPKRAAQKIGAEIQKWLSSSEILKATGKPIRPDDILILVRKRGDFMQSLTGELKRRGLPVAGLDKFELPSHIAVQDLMALGRSVLLAEDDLSLACLMKSPLLGLSEDDLLAIATNNQTQKGGAKSLFSMWQAHVKGPTASAAQKLALEQFKNWRALADNLSLFEFFHQVLEVDGGRQKLLLRLGPEAAEPINAFLEMAIDRQAQGLPSLDGFLHWLEVTRPEIKRQLQDAAGQIRIMTAHGAKGLEASIVFLVDDGGKPSNTNNAEILYNVPSKVPGKADALLWHAAKSGEKSGFAKAQDILLNQADEHEYKRLLYVGMTRAADKLIVCGYQSSRPYDRSWHKLVHEALVQNHNSGPIHAHLEELAGEDDESKRWRWHLARDDKASNQTKSDELEQVEKLEIAQLSTDLLKPAPKEAGLIARLTPSTAQALLEVQSPAQQESVPEISISPVFAQEQDQTAFFRGSLIHRLFESLPSVPIGERQEAAQAYILANAPDWTDQKREDAVLQVMAVMNFPSLQDIFSSQARGEVSISGELPLASGRRLVSGQIDRLFVSDNKVLIADFKTNRQVPKLENCPDAYITQMAIYAHLLKAIRPNSEVESLLIWTSAEKPDEAVMQLPKQLLDKRMAALLAN